MMRFIVLMIALMVLTFIFCTCKDAPTKPKDGNTDTTSHNFSWTITQLGDGASSVLNDVAIINDTLAYAVGAIYLKDSLGNWDPNAYNLVKWDGLKWNLKRLQFYTFCGQSSTGSYPTKAIWAFGPTDIWITSGSEITHYDGNNQSSTACIPVSVYKLWGTSSSDLYVVGAIGGIAHFNGTSWTKIESGTSLDIQDIYGAYNSVTSQWEVIAVAGNAGSSYDRKILQIKGTNISTLSDNPISLSLNGVWFVPNQRYYVVGDGIYEKSNLSDTSWIVHQLDITHYYTTQVKGNSTNDVFIIGAFGEFLHWNGKSWLSYQSVTGLSNGAYGSMAIRNNLVIAVGMDSPRAVVTIGRR